MEFRLRSVVSAVAGLMAFLFVSLLSVWDSLAGETLDGEVIPRTDVSFTVGEKC